MSKVKMNHQTINIPLGETMKYTGLTVATLKPNEGISITAPDNEEYCFVLLSGYGDLRLNREASVAIGNRMSVFDGPPPFAAYITAQDSMMFEAKTDVEYALCKAPNRKKYESRIIHPDESKVEHRGYGQIQRTAKNILPENDPADSLLVVEVITKGGNWSSFPSHRHDEDDLPNQSYLEEIYYHKLNPDEGGFAFQRVYNDDHSVDEVYVLENDCAILVKEGYHPVSVPPGYDLYYLNVMAGPTRTWKFYNDPFFEHLIK